MKLNELKVMFQSKFINILIRVVVMFTLTLILMLILIPCIFSNQKYYIDVTNQIEYINASNKYKNQKLEKSLKKNNAEYKYDQCVNQKINACSSEEKAEIKQQQIQQNINAIDKQLKELENEKPITPSKVSYDRPDNILSNIYESILKIKTSKTNKKTQEEYEEWSKSINEVNAELEEVENKIVLCESENTIGCRTPRKKESTLVELERKNEYIKNKKNLYEKYKPSIFSVLSN